jgi:hypothetical protein
MQVRGIESYGVHLTIYEELWSLSMNRRYCYRDGLANEDGYTSGVVLLKEYVGARSREIMKSWTNIAPKILPSSLGGWDARQMLP